MDKGKKGGKNEGNKPAVMLNVQSLRFTAMICWALLRFIRSSIHAPLSAGQYKSEALQPSALKGREKKRMVGQIGLVLRLFLQRLLQLARPLKKGPSAKRPWGKLWLILPQGSFSPRWLKGRSSAWLLIHLVAVSRYTPSPITSQKVDRQIAAVLPLVSADEFPSPCPSVDRTMLSWTTEVSRFWPLEQLYCLWHWKSLTQALGFGHSCEEMVVHSNSHPLGRPGKLSTEAACWGQWGSGMRDIFSLCGLCSHGLQVVILCNIDPSVWKASTENSQHENCRLLTAYTVTNFIARETNKRKLWGDVLLFLIISHFPKGQDGCHLSSTLSQLFCPKCQ